MTDARPALTAPARSAVSWGIVIAASLLTIGTIALVWLAAVPFGPIVCPAIYPAPRNCFAADRAATGLVVTGVTAAIGIATVLLALIGGRTRRRLAIIGVALLAVAQLVTYPLVAWIPFP